MGRTVIIGAGPAGLAAAVCLGRRGLPYVVLEAGEGPLSAIRRVDPDTTLLTPARLSRLPDMDMTLDRGSRGRSHLCFAELVALLEDYRETHGIAVQAGAAVERVEEVEPGAAGGARFRIRCRDGRVEHGDWVINATGMISHPAIPAIPEQGPAPGYARMHSLDVRASHLRGAQSLLVVGGGTSAAEVMETWLAVRAPGARAMLSLRASLRSVPSAIAGVDIHYFTWLPEKLPAHALAARFAAVRTFFGRDPVIGKTLARAIRAGLVEVVPEVVAWRGDEVEVAGGQRLRPDLVVFATGFVYAAPHLGELVDRDSRGAPVVRACESRRTPGLYVLGVRFGKSFASPYLRGIAADAAYVAGRIARGSRS